MSIGAWVSLAALCVSIGSLLLASGRWFGHADSLVRELSRLADEIEKLRKWRHHIGDAPYAGSLAILNQFEKRLDRLTVDIDKLSERVDRRQRGSDKGPRE